MTHQVVVGLGFGDEGKGTCVDWLCATRDIKCVIRYNGGAQAAHNVVMPDGRHHTFAQFGSGTLQGTPTHLSQYVLVNPFNIFKEAEHLEQLRVPNPLDYLTIASGALLITPYHVIANRLREEDRGRGVHGSTGQGIGETRDYDLNRALGNAPRIGDMLHPDLMFRKLARLHEHYEETFGNRFTRALPQNPSSLAISYRECACQLQIVPDDHVETILDSGDCVFEGAQGVLLDEDYGFHPHTTWTNTTTQNALALLEGRPSETIGVTRTYHTRHGAGPFPPENGEKTYHREPHNSSEAIAGTWRQGELDLTLLNYAVRAVRVVDTIMVTHMDMLGSSLHQCSYGYEYWDAPVHVEKLQLPMNLAEQGHLTGFLNNAIPIGYDLLETQDDVSRCIEMATGIRPTIFSYGATHEDKRVVLPVQAEAQ